MINISRENKYYGFRDCIFFNEHQSVECWNQVGINGVKWLQMLLISRPNQLRLTVVFVSIDYILYVDVLI